jgi:hypothetical protein
LRTIGSAVCVRDPYRGHIIGAVSTEPGETGRVTHDAESRLWVEQLGCGHLRRQEAVGKLHGLLVRVAVDSSRDAAASSERYDIGDTRSAAWSYRAPFEEVARIADLVSFYPEKVTITIDAERLEPAPGQNVISHGPDRNLSVDEIGGIQLVEDAAAAET